MFAVILFICFEIILPLAVKLIKIKFLKKHADWKKRINKIFFIPVQILIIVWAVSYILITIAQRYGLTNLTLIMEKTRDIIIIDIAWLLIRWKKEIQNRIILKSENKADKTSVEFIGKTLIIFFIFIAVLLILLRIGVNIVLLLAFGGLGAAALAFAAKDALANFFGGLMICAARPFVKNDVVEIPTQNILGHIEDIGWYSTRARDFDKAAVYVPNSIFSNAIIKNNTRSPHRRIEETVKIRYLDFSKITKIIKDIKKSFYENRQIDSSFPVLVYFTAYSEYSSDIIIKVYTRVTELSGFLKLKEEILFEIKAILEREKADIPFPVTSIDFLNQVSK